jgi:hypothetical protein
MVEAIVMKKTAISPILVLRRAHAAEPRSNVLRYLEPSKLNLIALTRPTLNANVAQLITMPIRIPAMNPQLTIISAMSRSET